MLILLFGILFEKFLKILELFIKFLDLFLKAQRIHFLIFFSNKHKLSPQLRKIFLNSIDLLHIKFLMLNNIILTIHQPFLQLWDSLLSIIKLFKFVILVDVAGMVGKVESLFLFACLTEHAMIFAALGHADEDYLFVVF